MASENFAQLVQIEADARVGRIGDQDRNQPLGPRDDIGPVEPALALATARLAEREQTGQPRPGCPVFGIKQERAAIAQVDARSWDQADAGRLLPRESAHHARDAAAIAKAKRAVPKQCGSGEQLLGRRRARSEEHTSELQSLMRISYAVFCLKKKKIHKQK